MEPNNILIPFDMIFDTEMGLLKYIKDNCLDPEEFEDGLIDQPDGINKYLLFERSMKNPLGIYTVREEDADYYYKEFMEKRYLEILKYSPKTGIYEYIKKMIEYKSSINITIICNIEEEITMIFDEFEDNVACITPDDYSTDIDLRMFDSIYVKNIEDLFKYGTPLDGKNVYIASYMHNFTVGLEQGPVPDVRVSTLVLLKADVSVIDMYPKDDYIICEG